MAEHALLSASSAERWLNCTPSARLTELVPNTGSAYAEEGTHAHALAELFNRLKFKEITKKEFNNRLKELKENGLYNGEMEGYALGFSEYIQEKYNELRGSSKTKTAIALFEQRLDFSEYVPEGFGTGDVILISDGILEVVDFKYGKGVPVSSKDNPQMKLYALGAYSTFSLVYGINKVKMTIYQPRLDNISTSEIEISALLKWAEDELKEKAHLAYDGAGDVIPGDHCRFCGIKAACRARAEENLKLQNYEFKHPNILTDDEISDILLIAERLNSWASDVHAFALAEAVAGKKWRGFKLVEGRSNRRYSDEAAVENTLTNDGYKEDQIFTKSLLGITAMEKLLTKSKFNKLLGGLVFRPQGKPTLVPETDPRPEFNQAELDFKDVDIESI